MQVTNLVVWVTEKQNNPKDGIINERQKYAENFKEQFLGSFVGYLEDLPERKQLFEKAIKINCFTTLTKLMLIQITEMFLCTLYSLDK